MSEDISNDNGISMSLDDEIDVSTSLQSSPSRPLAMELEQNSSAVVDRPLIYEAKQASSTQLPKSANVSSNLKQNTSIKKGAVSFSSTELSIDDTAQPIAKRAKKYLLIKANQSHHLVSTPNLKDLPLDTRKNLKQYEVNVHVFDDNPERRFCTH